MKKDIAKLLTQIEEEGKDLHPLQKRIIKNALRNLSQTFEDKDEFTSFDDTKFLLWEYSIMSAKKEIFAFATNRQNKSGYGFSRNQKLIDTQAGVIQRGVKISRIFGVNQNDYERFDFMELVRAQIAAGIEVWVAYANAAQYINSEEEHDEENYIIVDDKLLYKSFIVGEEARNSISFDKERIKKYRKIFEELCSRSYRFTLEDLATPFKEL